MQTDNGYQSPRLSAGNWFSAVWVLLVYKAHLEPLIEQESAYLAASVRANRHHCCAAALSKFIHFWTVFECCVFFRRLCPFWCWRIPFSPSLIICPPTTTQVRHTEKSADVELQPCVCLLLGPCMIRWLTNWLKVSFCDNPSSINAKHSRGPACCFQGFAGVCFAGV